MTASRPRAFTIPGNRINWRFCREVAENELRHARRKFPTAPVKVGVHIVRERVRQEIERLADNPLTFAVDIVDASIMAIGRSSYDAYGREQAILAYAAGRPAFLNRGGYHNQGTASVADRVNGGMAISEAIASLSCIRGEQTLTIILDHLSPLNRSAVAVLAEARRARGGMRRVA